MPRLIRLLRQRAGLLAVAMIGLAMVASSCSLDAALETDASGRVTALQAVRIESSWMVVAVAMLVSGGELAFEWKWERSAALTR